MSVSRKDFDGVVGHYENNVSRNQSQIEAALKPPVEDLLHIKKKSKCSFDVTKTFYFGVSDVFFFSADGP